MSKIYGIPTATPINPDKFGSASGEWVCIEKILFGYELLTEKPDDWDTNNTSYFKINTNSSSVTSCDTWDWFQPNLYWRHTGDVEPELAEFSRTAEPDGTPYNFKGITAFGHIYNTEKVGYWCFCAYMGGKAKDGVAANVMIGKAPNPIYPWHCAVKVTPEFGVYNLLAYNGGQGGETSVTSVTNARTVSMLKPVSEGNITRVDLSIYSGKQYYGEGDYIEIWGVRA